MDLEIKTHKEIFDSVWDIKICPPPDKLWVSLDSLTEYIINHKTELNFEMELLQALGREEK